MRHRALSVPITLFATILAATVAAQRAVVGAGDSLNPVHAIVKESLKAFIDAPLFEPTRQRAIEQPAAAPVALTSSEAPPPALHLLGVIHGDRDMAMVRRDDESKTTMLATGDHVGPWLVTILTTTGIRLSDRKRAFDYVIFPKGAGNSGPIDVAAPRESVGRSEQAPLERSP